MRIPRPVFLTVFGFVLCVASSVRAAATVDDAILHLKVQTTLLEKCGTDALGIRIDVAGPAVVLSGAVDRPETKAGAKAAAAGVAGVGSVDDRITVGNGPATRTREASAKAKANLDDSLLEAHVMARLLGQVGENAFRIGVHARGGVVTLRGEAPTAAIHATAVATAKATKGVVRVVDELKPPKPNA